jgi:NAD(P)H-hydrate epimerase
MHVPESIRYVVAGHAPEAIFSRTHSGTEFLKPLSKEEWESILVRITALAVGAGRGTDRQSGEFLRQVLQDVDLPAVLDADALNLISEDKSLRSLLTARHVLTPHPGELGRLLDLPVAEIQANRWAVARRAAGELGCVVLLKGYGTLVAAPDGNVYHNPTGNSALSRGGAGDVLTGLVGSLLAQGADALSAARLGAFLHGMTADIFVRGRSPRGALIRDLADLLPQAFRELEEV